MLSGKQQTAKLRRLLPWRKYSTPFVTEQTLNGHSGEASQLFLPPFQTASICREIVFLKEFGSHPNIIQLLNVHRAANDKDLYLVFEFMETDLHHVIKKGNILKGIHRQYIMYQLFKVDNIFFKISNLIMNLWSGNPVPTFGQCDPSWPEAFKYPPWLSSNFPSVIDLRAKQNLNLRNYSPSLPNKCLFQLQKESPHKFKTSAQE